MKGNPINVIFLQVQNFVYGRQLWLFAPGTKKA